MDNGKIDWNHLSLWDTITTLRVRVEELEKALSEAMEWNWLDDDVPPNVVEMCQAARGKPNE